MVKIGIPKALLYHKYRVLWETFFKELDCEVVYSPDTNQEIMRKGISLAVDESCLSMKIFLGHVAWLKDKVDYIFIPRIIRLHKKEQTCVKLWALYDITNNSIEGIDKKLISYTVDTKEWKFEWFELFKFGFKFNKNPIKILLSVGKAMRAQDKHCEQLLAEQVKGLSQKKEDAPSVLVVSHPYTTYDAMLGAPIIKFLREQNVHVLFAEIVKHEDARELSKNISTDLHWTYNKEIIGAIEVYRKNIDGILFLMTFPCGPDSLVIDLCQKKISDVPVVVVTLDELQGEAGLKTRLEIFADILKMKKKRKLTSK